ncbi:MAG: glycosyltransferase family 39 protein [Elusimicrobia bacterium]|nr:glycosyltransferase family 39 protein [Elusimicrobiota bacterium]
MLIFFFFFIVRVWGIGADLPNLYNPDEPHHLNIAAHFGTGDLNPHDFKYPTLWSYVIGAIFAFLFGFGRFLGLVESPGRFAQAYFYSPAVFYIAVRLFCATAVSSAAWIMYRTGARFYGRLLGVILGLFTALGPVFVTAGREATPYGLMIFWLALAVYQYHSLCENHNRCAWALTGLFIGLAVSTHYIAAPLAVWLVARFFIEPPADKQKFFPIFRSLGFWGGAGLDRDIDRAEERAYRLFDNDGAGRRFFADSFDDQDGQFNPAHARHIFPFDDNGGRRFCQSCQADGRRQAA